jgi:hypothetical protein
MKHLQQYDAQQPLRQDRPLSDPRIQRGEPPQSDLSAASAICRITRSGMIRPHPLLNIDGAKKTPANPVVATPNPHPKGANPATFLQYPARSEREKSISADERV